MTISSAQLRTMANELDETNEDGRNPVINLVVTTLQSARKSARALEAGNMGRFESGAQQEIENALVMAEAAKAYTLPELPAGRTHIATWDKATKTFTVRSF